MECKNCCFFYETPEDEGYATCHYSGYEMYAPCNYEEPPEYNWEDDV